MEYLVNDFNQVVRASDGWIVACMATREKAIELANMLTSYTWC